MTASTTPRRFWGWGRDSDDPFSSDRDALKAMMGMRLGVSSFSELPPPRLDDLELPAPRFSPPPALAAIFSQSPWERAAHTYGKAYRDVIRALYRDYRGAPDAVALPRTEEDIVRVLELCEANGLAAIPYGGGSSVVGGVEARLEGRFRGAVSIDLRGLAQVIEVDQVSRAARIQAGIFGPALEDALRPHGLSLRHYPQSFEFSTLGGWIATRAGGHFATLHTHIDDLVQALRVVTPRGTLESRRLPSSGAGPSMERLFLGSEGALGIITEAWMRLQERPRFRASASAAFADFLAGAEAVRQIAQSGLFPQNCRLLDADEALNSGAGDGRRSVLLVAFESADHPLDPWMTRALEICRGAGGEVPEGAGKTKQAGAREGEAGGAWRTMFLQGPYLRDALATLGMVVETFETAIPWSLFADFHARVSEAARRALAEVCGGGLVMCRLTHVYPDGAALYFTVLGRGEAGAQLRQWDEIKAAVSEAIFAGGGTITHHHAVGRDHRPYYDRERPPLFGSALSGVKGALDPAGIMNPGVLVG
jgi:alkyldihydroxyacetonephosphate synthase